MSIIFKKSIVAILIFALALPYGFLVFPKKAEAVVPVQDEKLTKVATSIAEATKISADNNVKQTGLQTDIRQTEASTNQYIASLHQKSIGRIPLVPYQSNWDLTANTMMKMMIGALTAQMVNWIQTGGSYPGGGSGGLFVNDIGGYMTAIADNAAGRYLEQVLDPQIFNLLCTNWRNQFANLLQRTSYPQLPYFQRARCTITDIMRNFGADTGSYSPYAANAYWQQIRYPQNNIYDSFLSAYYARSASVERRVSTANSELSFGQGFLSFKTMEDTGRKQCVEFGAPYSAPNYTAEGNCIKWAPIKEEKIKTPGKIIEDQLATQLGSGTRSLEIANSLNQIIAAIISRLITEILTGGQGIGGWQAGSSPAFGAFTEAQIQAQKPDLIVSGALNYSPLNPQAGQLLSFSGNIYDARGNEAQSVGAELKIDAGNDGTWDVSIPAVISLGGGGSGLANWQNVWTAVPGVHKFRICADPENLIDELNEDNNCTDMIFQVPDLSGLQANLVVEAAGFSPQNPSVGNLMTFRGAVRNAGSIAIASPSTARLRVDIGNNGSWDIDTNASVGQLLQNEKEEKVWADVWTATFGTHKFEICADVNNVVGEGNELDNCASGVFEVIKKPDLIVSSASFSPLYPGFNDLMTFKGIIKNQGDVASVSSSARLRIDVGDNGSWDVVLPEQPVSGLAPAGMATTTWQSAWKAFPGTSAFEICADIGGAINESNEQNNCVKQTFFVSYF